MAPFLQWTSNSIIVNEPAGKKEEIWLFSTGKLHTHLYSVKIFQSIAVFPSGKVERLGVLIFHSHIMNIILLPRNIRRDLF